MVSNNFMIWAGVLIALVHQSETVHSLNTL
jgi:hypothetical protein